MGKSLWCVSFLVGYIIMTCLITGGRLPECSKTKYYKSSLGIHFIQTCSLVSVNNGRYIYTACSYDTPQ